MRPHAHATDVGPLTARELFLKAPHVFKPLLYDRGVKGGCRWGRGDNSTYQYRIPKFSNK
eukprot:5568853-Amphidinium_carterae.2